MPLENGTYHWEVQVAYSTGDIFRVAVEGGAVKYKKNGTVFYTSTLAPTYPLLVDTSLFSNGVTLSNVVIGSGSGSSLKYVLQDLQGSTRAVMNNNGSSSAIIARHDYLPFGEEIGSGTGLRTGTQGYGATDTNRQKYAMLERDDATGLDHTWWRKYESFSGRWTSPDPYSGSMSIANPQSFNRYAHVGNDPVNLVDPTGLFCMYWETVENTAKMMTITAHEECFLEGGGGGGGDGGGVGVDLGGGAGGGGGGQGPQGPALPQPKKTYDITKIIDDIKKQQGLLEKAKELNKQAWMDYESCVAKDPAVIEYRKALQAAIVKASIPLPGPIAISRVSIRTASGAASLVSRANIFTLVFGGMLHVLLANPSVETRELRDKTGPVEEKCMKQTKEKYGFTPVFPWSGKP
jgi:RHS repeat-associated protein